GGASVAEKPQAAAIRAEALDRELIVTGSTRSVVRGAIARSRGTARTTYWDARREPPAGGGECVRIGGVRRQPAPRHRPRAQLSAAQRCSAASGSARLQRSPRTPHMPSTSTAPGPAPLTPSGL